MKRMNLLIALIALVVSVALFAQQTIEIDLDAQAVAALETYRLSSDCSGSPCWADVADMLASIIVASPQWKAAMDQNPPADVAAARAAVEAALATLASKEAGHSAKKKGK